MVLPAGILVVVMRKSFSVFQIGLIGSIILWFGLIAAAFAPDIPCMVATFGVIHGAGVGIVLIAAMVAIVTHFDKYRGVAAGLKYTGNSLSSLVLPKVLSLLRAAYSMRGTMLIYGALCMNSTAFVLFLRERRPATRKHQGLQETWRRRPEEVDFGASSPPGMVNVQNVSSVIEGKRHSIKHEPTATTKKRRSMTQPFGSGTIAPSSSHDVSTPSTGHELSSERNDRVGISSLLVSPTFYALVLGALTVDYTVTVVNSTIVDYARDRGVDRATAELSMTYCAPAIFLGRLLLPLAADAGLIGRTSLASLCLACMAASALVLPHTAAFVTYIFAQVLLAFFLSCLGTLKAVLAADNFGAEAVPAYYGANGIALVPVLLANPSLTGYFRDTMGSYDNLFRLMAGLHLITSAIYFVLAYKQRRPKITGEEATNTWRRMSHEM
ncbi:hypothetical protein V5799_000881 [Amblyomma americanum]|uniref:Monocarboxylate transporter n=1 Tax=Amblyomma americanum TaxID=6943 RepID=A0AAQ4D1S7_AMBAM